MDSYIVRIYRRGHNNVRSFVGIVEEVGVEEKKAFTNLDELGKVLMRSKKRIPFKVKYKYEKRKEVRRKKDIPFKLIYNHSKLNARTMNFSRRGLGAKIYEKFDLPIGNIISLRTKELEAKAEVIWVDRETDPSATIAGLRIIDRILQLKGSLQEGRFVLRGGGSEASFH